MFFNYYNYKIIKVGGEMAIKNQCITLLVVLISVLTISSGFGSCFSNISSLNVFESDSYEDSFTDASKWECVGNVYVNETIGKLVLQSGFNKIGWANYNGIIQVPGIIYQLTLECAGECFGVCNIDVSLTADNWINSHLMVEIIGMEGDYNKSETWNIPEEARGSELDIGMSMAGSSILLVTMTWLRVTYWYEPPNIPP